MVIGWGLILVILVPVLAHWLYPEIDNTVTQKYHLTSHNYCNTVIAIGRAHMANVLNTGKQIAVISALAEGSSIRSKSYGRQFDAYTERTPLMLRVWL
jgi:hypothetical protein